MYTKYRIAALLLALAVLFSSGCAILERSETTPGARPGTQSTPTATSTEGTTTAPPDSTTQTEPAETAETEEPLDVSGSPAATKEEAEIRAVVMDFLNKKAQNEHLWTAHNLNAYAYRDASGSTAPHIQTFIDIVSFNREWRRYIHGGSNLNEAYQCTYDFTSVVQNQSSATAEVAETVNVYYSRDGMNFSSALTVRFVFDLRHDGEVWTLYDLRIPDDIYYGYTDRRDTDFNWQHALQDAKQNPQYPLDISTQPAQTRELAEIREFMMDFLDKKVQNEHMWAEHDLTAYAYLDKAGKPTPHIQTFIDVITLDREWRKYIHNNVNMYTSYTNLYMFYAVEVSQSYATVVVSETAARPYRTIDGETGTSTLRIQFTFTLLHDGEAWGLYDLSIPNDNYYFYEDFKDTDFDWQAYLEYSIKQHEDNASASTNSVIPNTNAPAGELDPVTDPADGYDSTAAAYYNYRAYTQADATGYAAVYASVHNSKYSNWSGAGGDCMNFASQCVWAGFKGDNNRTAATDLPR